MRHFPDAALFKFDLIYVSVRPITVETLSKETERSIG